MEDDFELAVSPALLEADTPNYGYNVQRFRNGRLVVPLLADTVPHPASGYDMTALRNIVDLVKIGEIKTTDELAEYIEHVTPSSLKGLPTALGKAHIATSARLVGLKNVVLTVHHEPRSQQDTDLLNSDTVTGEAMRALGEVFKALGHNLVCLESNYTPHNDVVLQDYYAKTGHRSPQVPDDVLEMTSLFHEGLRTIIEKNHDINTALILGHQARLAVKSRSSMFGLIGKASGDDVFADLDLVQGRHVCHLATSNKFGASILALELVFLAVRASSWHKATSSGAQAHTVPQTNLETMYNLFCIYWRPKRARVKELMSSAELLSAIKTKSSELLADDKRRHRIYTDRLQKGASVDNLASVNLGTLFVLIHELGVTDRHNYRH